MCFHVTVILVILHPPDKKLGAMSWADATEEEEELQMQQEQQHQQHPKRTEPAQRQEPREQRPAYSQSSQRESREPAGGFRSGGGKQRTSSDRNPGGGVCP